MSAADHRLKGLDRVGFERLQDALLKQGSGMLATAGAGGGGVGCAATSSLKLTLVNADNPRDATSEVVPVGTTLAEARQLAAATFGFAREARARALRSHLSPLSPLSPLSAPLPPLRLAERRARPHRAVVVDGRENHNAAPRAASAVSLRPPKRR